MKHFLYYYLRSMRLYYGFVTGATTLVGVAAAHAGGGAGAWGRRDGIVLAVGFLAWGVNQIFNDATNLAEDRINAPDRPLVSGALPLKGAILLSALLMLLFAAASIWLTPWTLLPVAGGAAFNLLYSGLKKVPVLGCLVYGASISMCAVYGWIGVCGGLPAGSGVAVLFLTLLPVHALMCHNSYFKDAAGDRAAKKWTLQVLCPVNLSLRLSGLGQFALAAYLFFLLFSGGNRWAAILYVPCLLLLSAALLRRLMRREYHTATLLNALWCVAQTMGFAVCFAAEWLIAAAGMLPGVVLLFGWYKNEKE